MLTTDRKIRDISKYFILSAFLLIMILQGCSSSLNVISEESLANISSYKFGDSRIHLSEFAQIIDSLAKSKESREMAEEDLLKFLQSDATFAGKQFACRELRIIGSEKSASVLLEMLMNDKTTDIAKYALENIQGEKIDEALTELLLSTKKNIKIAIINTLAVRGNKNSTPPIGELLKSTDNEIAITAASALGKLGDKKAFQYLETQLNTSNLQLRSTILDSYLLSIDKLVNQQKLEEANSYYLNLHSKDIPTKMKQATLVGIIKTSGNKGKEILNRITSEPDKLKFIPISKIRELPADTDLNSFVQLMPTLKPANQIQMLAAFKDLGNKNIKSDVLKMLGSEIKDVRIAAIKTLASVGNESDAFTLANIAATKTGLERSTARATLDLLKGDKIDDSIILGMSSAKDLNVKVELIRSVGARNITSAFNNILIFTKSENNKIKSEAFKSLASISTDKNLDTFIEVLLDQKTNSERKKVERAISRIITNYPNENNSKEFINQLNSQNDIDIKCTFLRLLGFTNESNSLKILQKEIMNNNKKIKLAAITGLSNWQTAEPLKDLMNCMITGENENIKSAALKGFTKFIGLDRNLKKDDKFGLYKKSLQYSKTGNEKNTALDGIGRINKFEALEILKSYINQPQIARTVNDGITRVSWNLRNDHPEKIKKYITELLPQINTVRFQTKSKNLLNEIEIIQKSKSSK
jgi:HEAT repeat protein